MRSISREPTGFLDGPGSPRYIRPLLPLWIKVVHTLVAAVVVPVNLRAYGARNFLWFSDVALLLMLPALWAESAVLVSAAAIGALAVELAWDLDYLCGLAFGRTPIGLAAYMFDPKLPLWLRAVSLFHLWLQAAIVLGLSRLGYDERGLALQIVLCWLVLPASAALSRADENINWALGPRGRPPPGLSPRVYLALEMAALPAAVYFPTHLLLAALFGL